MVLPVQLKKARQHAPDSQHPFPTSLTQGRKTLKAHAHVNICDYMKERAKLRKARDANQVAVIREKIKTLNFPSANALKKCVAAICHPSIALSDSLAHVSSDIPSTTGASTI